MTATLSISIRDRVIGMNCMQDISGQSGLRTEASQAYRFPLSLSPFGFVFIDLWHTGPAGYHSNLAWIFRVLNPLIWIDLSQLVGLHTQSHVALCICVTFVLKLSKQQEISVRLKDMRSHQIILQNDDGAETSF